MPRVLSRLPPPHAHRGVLRRLRRPLRLSRADHVRDRRRARRARARTASGRCALDDRRDARATTRCSSPTATTGSRAGPNRRSRAPTTSRASSCTRTPTSTTRSSRASASVVLGMGNSAMDIAVESSYVAERTYLAARRGVWIIPKYMFGKPVDQLRNDPRVPFKVRQRFDPAARHAATSGRPSATGCPSPTTASARPTRRSPGGSSTASSTARSRRSRTSSRCEGSQVRFVDGSVGRGRRRRLLHRLPDHPSRSSTRTSSPRPTTTSSCSAASSTPTSPNVFFVGLLQPLGAIMPLAEAQGAWVGDYLLGDYALPPRTRRCAPTSRPTRRRMRKRYVASKRHTIQVDFDDYLYALDKERARGPSGRAPTASAASAMPTFCRHNRFLERCPICSKTLPGNAPRDGPRAARRRARGARAGGAAARSARRARGRRRCACAASSARAEDGYSSRSCPACAPRPTPRAWPRRSLSRTAACCVLARRRARRRASTREVARWRASDLEQATLDLLPDRLPVPAGGRRAVRRHPSAARCRGRRASALARTSRDVDARARARSHDPARGARDARAYRAVGARGRPAIGQQARFAGDPSWTPQRRFERLFERLALPGLDARRAL